MQAWCSILETGYAVLVFAAWVHYVARASDETFPVLLRSTELVITHGLLGTGLGVHVAGSLASMSVAGMAYGW